MLKILLVDDEPVNLRVLDSMLARGDFALLEAATGEECLELVRRERPDIVLLDVVLPGLSGPQVSERIKADPELEGTYVILVSERKVSRDDRIEGLQGGADAYLPRPFSRRELLAYLASGARVRSLLRRLELEVERRVRSEAGLRETVGLLSMAERMAALGSWRWHAEGDRFQVSEQSCALLGLARADGSGDFRERLLGCVHPEDRGRLEAYFGNLGAPGAPALEFRVPREGRAPRTLRIEASQGPVEGGTAVHGILQDVTDRVAREEERARILRLEGENRLARQRTSLLRNLHDGIGGIVTNINLLAELSLGGEVGAGPRETLETIRALSREGVSEMRTVMDTLEEVEVRWRSLFVEMRQHGTAMLDPHGVRLEARAGGPGLSEPLGLFVYMTVLRIFKEAVTNAVKHALARKVTLNLEVGPGSMTMVVGDDGRGLPSLVPVGRGLRNMQVRAEEIGGRLAVQTLGKGTVVTLVVPLPAPESSASPGS